MRRAWFVILALAGCRQVFGIDEPLPGGGNSGIDAARSDGRGILFDGAIQMPGLAMYVQDGASLWTNDEPPDLAWQQTNNMLAKASVWTGADPMLGDLLIEGLIDGQHPFSVWMEGQISIPDGMEQLRLTATDYAFVDIETVPFTGQFQHAVTCRNGNAQSKSISVPLPGWLRVRIGWSTTPNTATFDLVHGDGNMPGLTLFTATDLRH